ncbi:serine carboxypeptidase-like 44 [Gossypium hirsutum]|uniref:Serine carboxypeptidase-like 44 n=1 Tax=Gossypium hirsutum TaxID=3635 RepID=A0A1U8NKA6_GOSHI|nr:serine carboxypeptidase-like 44 [Gossypium hirsutum]
MEFRGVIFISFLFFQLGVNSNAFPMNDLISKLPGQPDVNFRQFVGYIDVDENVVGRSLFYYFVEAEKDPLTQPLTVWLTGGPGCSSVGDAFGSVGPFIVTKDAHDLQKNLFSWNKVSNLLFIDSPIGSEWSYSNTSSDYNNGDDITNKILLTFMQKWYEKYPVFKSKDLYLARSSFAGHFAPNLANALLDDNKQSKQSKFNLKGLILGNPMLRKKLDDVAKIDFFFSREMINSSLYNEIKKECNAIDEYNYFSSIKTTWSAKCKNLVFEADLAAFKTDAHNYSPQKLFDVFRPPCAETEQDLNLGKQVPIVSTEVDMCHPLRVQFYFNLPEVQKAFHGNQTNLPYRWKGCFTANFKYNEADKDLDMLPALKNPLQKSVPITIFSGDQDGIIPIDRTLQHLEKLAEELNIKLTKEETWSFGTKEGGLKYEFGDLLRFLTVKGGNHHVTSSRPSQAFSIFSNFTINWMH